MKYTLWLLLIISVSTFKADMEYEGFPSRDEPQAANANGLPDEDLENFQDGEEPSGEDPCREKVEEALKDDKEQASLEEFRKDAIRSSASLSADNKLEIEHFKFDWMKCFNHGLTWKVRNHECESGLNFVGCSWCNPYIGDTWCWLKRPLLCIYKAQDVRPDYPITGSGWAMPVEFYHGWSGGHIKATRPIRGCYIYNKKHADHICRKYFGNGWEMAAHGDGKYMPGMGGSVNAYSTWNWAAALDGGWNFYAYGDFEADDTRYWTYIHDQPGNCWN